jgi:integrase
MPDLKEFKKMRKMKVADTQYTAPCSELMRNLIAKAELLKTECIDTWLTFELSYSVGLRWGEIRHAVYSWFYPEQIRNMAGEQVTNYVCHVQATDKWTPKAHSTGKVKISKQLYDDIMATKGMSRERMQLSPSELERLVWSRPSTEVAKELGYTNEGFGKMCSRLGISKPRAMFWKKVAAGTTPHPQGRPAKGYRIWGLGDSSPANVVSMDTLKEDEPVLKRHNGDGNNYSSANRRLKRWMKKHGWDRNRAAHEMRAYNGAMITTLTGNLYEAQKRLRHKSVRTTERYYADLIAPSDVAINLPSSQAG